MPGQCFQIYPFWFEYLDFISVENKQMCIECVSCKLKYNNYVPTNS